MTQAGLEGNLNSVQARTLATAAAFCVADETIVLTVFRPPAVDRHQVGPARLLVITESRAIEVLGEMAGDWWSQIRPIQAGPVSVAIRELSDFTGLTFQAEAVQWWMHDSSASLNEFVSGTSATLTGPAGTEALVVWSPADDNGYSRAGAKARLDFLHRIAARRTPENEAAPAPC